MTPTDPARKAAEKLHRLIVGYNKLAGMHEQVLDKILPPVDKTAEFIQSAISESETDLIAALKEFTSIWGSRDAHSESKRAAARRVGMWAKAQNALNKRGITL